MSSMPSRDNLVKVEEAHRFLIALNQLSMPMMLRNMAAIRYDMPPEGVEFTDREKTFLKTFRDCPDPKI